MPLAPIEIRLPKRPDASDWPDIEQRIREVADAHQRQGHGEEAHRMRTELWRWTLFPMVGRVQLPSLVSTSLMATPASVSVASGGWVVQWEARGRVRGPVQPPPTAPWEEYRDHGEPVPLTWWMYHTAALGEQRLHISCSFDDLGSRLTAAPQSGALEPIQSSMAQLLRVHHPYLFDLRRNLPPHWSITTGGALRGHQLHWTAAPPATHVPYHPDDGHVFGYRLQHGDVVSLQWWSLMQAERARRAKFGARLAGIADALSIYTAAREQQAPLEELYGVKLTQAATRMLGETARRRPGGEGDEAYRQRLGLGLGAADASRPPQSRSPRSAH